MCNVPSLVGLKTFNVWLKSKQARQTKMTTSQPTQCECWQHTAAVTSVTCSWVGVWEGSQGSKVGRRQDRTKKVEGIGGGIAQITTCGLSVHPSLQHPPLPRAFLVQNKSNTQQLRKEAAVICALVAHFTSICPQGVSPVLAYITGGCRDP